MVAEAKKHHELSCPECGVTHTKNSTNPFTPVTLGVHRKFEHGISGKPAYVKKNKKQNQEKLKDAEITVNSGYEAANNKRRSKESDFLVLVTIGRIQALCESIAERHQIPKDAFTKRCAELFHASTLW
jgi:hypothetical protein